MRPCVESCAIPQSKIIFEELSKALVVTQGGKRSSNQSSRRSVHTQSQIASPRSGMTQRNMEVVENTIRLPEFQGFGS